MDILKIKYDGRRVSIKYQDATKNPIEPDIFYLESNDQPTPDFKIALNRLNAHFAKICDLPEDYCYTIEVRGVSLSYFGDENIMGATITGLKSLSKSNAPLVINTPHLPECDYNGNDMNECILPSECVSHIKELIAQTRLYIQGEREQRDMFAEFKEQAA